MASRDLPAERCGVNDIVERIRSLRYVHVPVASQLFEEACAEIQRLRLTDEERQAILTAIQLCEDITYGGAADQHAADVLRSLLARLK